MANSYTDLGNMQIGGKVAPTPTSLATLQNMGGSGKGQMSIPNMPMPDWLTTDPNDLLGEIMNEYKSSNKYFNPAGINKAYNTSINTTMGMGGQIADNAMRESMARAGQEGGSANSAMAKAQAMLPVYDTANKLRTEKATAIADMRTREASMRAGLAQSMGQMRSQYLAMLGDVYMKGKGMNMQWQNQLFGQGMMARQQAMQESQMSMARHAANQSAGSGSSAPKFQGQITRAPNNAGGGAGVEYTPQYKEYLATQGGAGQEALLAGAPQYPQGGGTGFGDSLDSYNKDFRDMLAMATGQPAYNMSTSNSSGGQMRASTLATTGGRGGYGQPPGFNPYEKVKVGDQMVPAYHGKPIVRTA